MIQEMEKYKIDILGLSEVKKKGIGETSMDKGYIVYEERHYESLRLWLVTNRWQEFLKASPML